jgi:metal-responsive CopG/Arc/MetJ family transcriptional regulator
MQRFSISFDDELAAWVESRAEERGVSKAKVIRDAVATARESDTDLFQTGDVIAGLEYSEDGVEALD